VPHSEHPWHRFNSREFVELNRHKCAETRVFDLGALSLVAGLKDGAWYSPFSAPFGGFDCGKKNLPIEQIDASIQKLCDLNLNFKISLPPPLYGEDLVSKYASSLLRHGFTMAYADLNYHLDLRGTTALPAMKPREKSKLNAAIRAGLAFRHIAGSVDEKQAAHQLILKNRMERGYGPHLPLEEFLEIAKIIPVDFFLVERAGQPVSAAIIYSHSTSIWPSKICSTECKASGTTINTELYSRPTSENVFSGLRKRLF
jgi:hypothetical protein